MGDEGIESLVNLLLANEFIGIGQFRHVPLSSVRCFVLFLRGGALGRIRGIVKVYCIVRYVYGSVATESLELTGGVTCGSAKPPPASNNNCLKVIFTVYAFHVFFIGIQYKEPQS